MLMEADLPEDIEALRALALDQSRKLADVTVAKGEADAEIERLQSALTTTEEERDAARAEEARVKEALMLAAAGERTAAARSAAHCPHPLLHQEGTPL